MKKVKGFRGTYTKSGMLHSRYLKQSQGTPNAIKTRASVRQNAESARLIAEHCNRDFISFPKYDNICPKRSCTDLDCSSWEECRKLTLKK